MGRSGEATRRLRSIMDGHANCTVSDQGGMIFQTPRSTRYAKMMLSFVMLLGTILFSVGAAIVIYPVALQLGAPPIAACAPAAAASFFFARLGWQIVTAPIRFRICFGPRTVEIGDGPLRHSYAYDEVETISLPEHEEDGYGVALEGGTGGAFIQLSPRDEMLCAQILRARCVNAIFVDRSGQEYLPPNPDEPLACLGTLYRRSRWLAFASVTPVLFVGAICVGQSIIFGCAMFGLIRLSTSDAMLVGIKFLVELTSLVLLVRFALKRINKMRAIRNRMMDFRNTVGQ